MLDDFPRDALHVGGFLGKYVFFCIEEVDERVFLFWRVKLMCTVRPSVHSGSNGISFTSFNGLKVVPILFVSSGYSSEVCSIPESSCLAVASSAKSEHSTSHLYVWHTMVPMVMVPARPGILSFR
jgi:hypothetical protein